MVCGGIMIFGTVALIFILYYTTAYYKTKEHAKAWRAMAKRLELDYDEGGLFKPGRIHGFWNEHQVEVEAITRGAGKSQITVTQLRVHANPKLELGLRISCSDPFSEVGELFGFQDLKTGDAEFDARFVVKGEDEGGVLSLLGAQLRAEMLAFESFAPGAWFHDDGVTWEVRNVESNTTTLEKILRRQIEMTRVLSKTYIQTQNIS